VSLPTSHTRVVGECGYAGAIFGLGLAYFGLKGAVIGDLAEILTSSTAHTAGLIAFAIIPLITGILFAGLARGVIQRFVGDTAYVAFNGVFDLLRAVTVIGVVYYFSIRPATAGGGINIALAILAIGFIHFGIAAAKLLTLIRGSERQEND
jgi:hypothetical protein